jgi:aspartate racemase
MSWESTVTYYRLINETVKKRLGGLHSAKIVLYSVDFHEIEQLQRVGDWEKAGELLANAARSLERAGADFLLLCCNTMYKVASALESAVSLPLVHIADATAEAVMQAGIDSVGLLGTQFTMEQAFYRDRLQKSHDLQVLIPLPEDRAIVHRVIYDELCLGNISAKSRGEYRRIIGELVATGAQGIILGCTEISLLVTQQDSAVPLFDTTFIHAYRAAEEALIEG